MKIVVLDGYTLNPGDLNWSGLYSLGDVTVYERTLPDEIIARSKGAECVLTNKTPLKREVMDQLPDLRYIGVLATGYNIVDTAAAKQKGIVVTNVPIYGTTSVAQMVFSHILNLMHPVEIHNQAVRNGKWNKSSDFCFWVTPLNELAGKTLGIIGFGRIGQQVAAIASAFSMQVIVYDIFQPEDADENMWVSLEQLYRESDIISLHCPLTQDTEKMINRNALRLMKPTAYVINTSRGQLIHEEDFAEALNNGTIAGAGIDVLSTEPPSEDNPMLTARNCHITPHISWATYEARSRLMATAVQNINDYISGTPKNTV